MTIDLTSPEGARADARLRADEVAWLVTVGPSGTPVPTPVWFLWDGETLLVYSQPDKPKLWHVATNPRVALALRTDERGDDIIVVTGEAAEDPGTRPANEVPAYLDKYLAPIERLGYTPEQFATAYSVPIRIRPTKLRAWHAG